MSVSGLRAESCLMIGSQQFAKLCELPQGHGSVLFILFIGVNDVPDDVGFVEIIATHSFVLQRYTSLVYGLFIAAD